MRDQQLRLGLIGYPLGHSLSPALHEYFLRENGLSGCYHKFEVVEQDLPRALDGLKVLGFRGANVTIPYKRTVLPYLDTISETAQWMQAVNTLTITEGKLLGENTDLTGFALALKRNDVEIENKKAVVFGAGGAARAVIWTLVQGGIGAVELFNRTGTTAKCLADEVANSTGYNKVRVRKLARADVSSAVQECALVINATSLGMWPAVEQSPHSFATNAGHLTAIDLVYNPPRTRFLTSAKAAGAKTVGGLDMFIYQAFESLRLWVKPNDALKMDVTGTTNFLKALLSV